MVNSQPGAPGQLPESSSHTNPVLWRGRHKKEGNTSRSNADKVSGGKTVVANSQVHTVELCELNINIL